MNLSWWMVIPAVLIVLVWAGWFIGAWLIDRNRARDVATDLDRPAADPAEGDSPPPDRP